MELLTNDPSKCRLKEYRDFEKIDILALATIGKFDLPKETLKTTKISYMQALEFVKVKFLFLQNIFNMRQHLLKIFQYNIKTPVRIDEYAAKVLIDGAFSMIFFQFNLRSINQITIFPLSFYTRYSMVFRTRSRSNQLV